MTPHACRVAYLIGQFPAINHRYLLQEIRCLRQCGVEVQVASVAPPDRPEEELTPEEREETAHVYCLKRENLWRTAWIHLRVLLKRPLSFLRGLACAIATARAQRRPLRYAVYYFAEAILTGAWMQRSRLKHLHTSFTSGIGLIASRIFPISHSFAVYGYGELYDPLGNLLREKIAGATFVRSVSLEGCGQLMLAVPPDYWSRILYRPLGVDPAEFAPRTTSSAIGFEILSVGRLAPEKGQRILLRAVARLRRAGHDVRLRLVGDGPDRSSLHAFTQTLGISKSVIFEGWVCEARLDELYGSAQAFALSSLYEGTPIVLMEAMARQLPCVAPRINGISELITHGVDGLLFSPTDDAALACQIEQLLNAPNFGRRLGSAARRKIVEDYDIFKSTRRFAEAFLGKKEDRSVSSAA